MKHFIKYTVLCFVVMLSFTAAKAQQSLQMKIGYNISTPVGSSFTNLVKNTSFRGFTAELAYPVNRQLSIGLGASYNDYYQKYPRQVIPTKDGDISAVVSNSIQTTPVVAKVTYSLLKDGTFRPYIGAGAGMNFIQYNQFLGEFADSKSTLKPAVQADAGLNIVLNKNRGSGLNVGANFNYLPFNYADVKNLNNWGVHAGFFFPLR